jgi:hypothetical protein
MLAELVDKLRVSPSTAATFGDRVTPVADASRAITYTALAYPAAYVCPLSEDAERQAPGANENHQRITSLWGVIVALEATEDIRGAAPALSIETVRRDIFRAIYNWSPNFATQPHAPMEYRYGNIWYEGTKLLEVSRAATFWLISMGAYCWICGAEGEGETDQFEPPYTGILERVHVYNDWIDPHDPGLPPSEDYGQPPVGPPRGPAPWPTGPEGRIESEFRVELPQTQPSPRGHRNGRKH